MTFPLTSFNTGVTHFNENHLSKKENVKVRLWFRNHLEVKEFYKKIVVTKGSGSQDAMSVSRAIILGHDRCHLEDDTVVMIPPKNRLLGGGRKDVVKFRAHIKLLERKNQRILIPWENNFTIACGIDEEGNPKAGLVDLRQLETSIVPTLEEGKARIHLITSDEEKESHLDLMLGAGLSGTAFSVSGALNLAETMTVDNSSASVVLHHSFVTKNHIEITNFGDISFLKKKIEENLDKFIKIYGTHCISGYITGGSFYGQLTFSSKNKDFSKKMAIKAQASIKYGSLNFYLGVPKPTNSAENPDPKNNTTTPTNPNTPTPSNTSEPSNPSKTEDSPTPVNPSKAEGPSTPVNPSNPPQETNPIQIGKGKKEVKHQLKATGKLRSNFFNSIKAVNTAEDLTSNFEKYLEKIEHIEKMALEGKQPLGPMAAICVPWIEIFKCSEELYEKYAKSISEEKIQKTYLEFVLECLEKGRFWDAAHACVRAEIKHVDYPGIIKQIFEKNGNNTKHLALDVGNLLRFFYGLQVLKEKQASILIKPLLITLRDSIQKIEKINLVEFFGDVIVDAAELMENPQNYENFRKILSLLQDNEIEACMNYTLNKLTKVALKKQLPYLFRNEKTFDLLQERLKGYLENNQIQLIADLLLEEEKTLGHALLLMPVLEKYKGAELFSLCHFIRSSTTANGVSYLRKYVREQVSHPIVIDLFLYPKMPCFIVNKDKNHNVFKRPHLWLIEWLNQQQLCKISLSPFQKSEVSKNLIQNQIAIIRKWQIECTLENGKPRFILHKTNGKKFRCNIVLAAGEYSSL